MKLRVLRLAGLGVAAILAAATIAPAAQARVAVGFSFGAPGYYGYPAYPYAYAPPAYAYPYGYAYPAYGYGYYGYYGPSVSFGYYGGWHHHWR